MRRVSGLIIIMFGFAIMVGGCAVKTDATVTVDGSTVINGSYIGNGAQWDPYQLDYGSKKLEISQQDWQKLYSRLDFMKPQFMRVMINTTSVIENDTLSRGKGYKNLQPILQYCQSRNVQVVFGDWGGGMVNSRNNTVNDKNLMLAAKYLDFLVNTKGFSCIKYYNMINEPNGDWSATNENYDLWQRAAKQFYADLTALGLNGKVKLMGPDAAIWKADKADWVSRTAQDLGDAIGVYDIHTYPSKITVNSGEYSTIIKAYKDAVPKGKPIVMGEIGFKFVEKADAALLKENHDRAVARPYASPEDSQMFVYDYMYGTDMADALFQTVNAGYSGSVVWMLDDAMHSKGAKDKLKVWGFWNILGDEYFGADEENVRPWYYAWSLLTKYMPAGSKVFKVTVSGDKNIKAIAVEKNGSYMVAVVNVGKVAKQVHFEGSLPVVHNAREFIYAKGKLKTQGDHILLPNKEDITLDVEHPQAITLPAEGLVVITNFDY